MSPVAPEVVSDVTNPPPTPVPDPDPTLPPPAPAPAPGAEAEVSVTPDAPSETPATPIDDVRARLAARGLLATRPAIVVPKEPRPERPEIELRPIAPPDRDGDQHWAESDQDEWDVEVPPGAEETTVRCPQCREVFFRPLESTRFACPTCDRAWRFAVCGECDELMLAMERQESWRCGKCNEFTRSWWRTPSAPRDAAHVVARRKHQLVEAERAAVRAGIKKRRWKLVALAVWAGVAAVGVVIGVRLTEPSAASGTRVACAHFDRLRSDLASGTVGAAELDRQLDQLQAEAEGADEDVAQAVVDLRAAGHPGSSSFLVARTGLADACTRALD